jgi:protocatechuate 3,4-dioxygenase beta subunit
MIRMQCWSLFTVWLMAATTHAQEDGAFAVRGRVVDAAAKPVAGAMVRLLAPSFSGLEVDEKTATDADGRFSIAAPKNWIRMDASQRQELALLAAQGNRITVVQFHRNSAPPKSEVELMLSNVGESKIAVLAPDLRPVVGAKVKIVGLISDTIRVDLTEAEVRQYAGNAKKTSIGYVIGTGTVGLPPELQIEISSTDAKGLATVSHVAAAGIGAITVHADEFGEQTVLHYSFQGAKAPDWANRIVLKKTGQLVGQLSSPIAEAVAHREVTLTSFEQDNTSGIFHSSSAKVVTDREGKFEAPKMVHGAVQFTVKFDPSHPTRPVQTTSPPQLKAGETLHVKIDLKPAVRVEGRVLEAASKKPIRDVQVRAFLGMGFESTTSDAEGKFVFWMPPGETAFHPDIPEEYLSALRPSDYFDPAKRQQTLTLFKIPDGKSFEAPPILLHRPTTLRGVVLDGQGRPLPGTGISGISMSLDRRTGQPKPREVSAQANERGEFSIAGIDPREPMRLRVTAKEGSKVVTIAKPASEAVRIVLEATERFDISGRVADAEGKPVADAILEIWHRDWRPAPTEAEPKKLNFKEPIRADGQGRFKTPPLAPDGHYRFTIRAAGAKTTESAWLDATLPEAGKPQQLVVTRLGGLSGVVRDRGGKPIGHAMVSLFATDTRTETTTNGQGEFKLETPAGKPFCVVVRHPVFRVDGSYYDRNPSNLNQTMSRLTEPAEQLALRPILAKEEREKILKRLFEPFKQKLVKSTNTQEKVTALQSLTGIAPEFVTEFLDKNPLQPAMYNEMLLTQVAMKRVSQNPEEAEELIGHMGQGAQKSMAYGLLVDALPEKARARKLEILAEALVGARAEKSPELRAVALGQVAKRLFLLGQKDRATTLLREGEKIANSLSTSAWVGFARASFATDLALIDLPAALALMKDLTDRSEFARHHGNTAHRIAGTHPAEAVRVLDLIPPPRQNEFNQRDQYAIRACYRMAQVDLKAALKLASSITDLPSRAHALGVIAQGVAKTEPKQASDLLRRAFALLEEDAARPDPPQLTSPLLPGSVAAALVLIAEQIDPTLVRECLWRSVALQRPHTEDPQQVWRYTTGNNALAMVAARYDGKLAESLLPAGTAGWVSRELQLAGFLANPQRAVETAEKASKVMEDRELLQLLGYLATDEDRVSRLILNTLGMWRIDVEDIDF